MAIWNNQDEQFLRDNTNIQLAVLARLMNRSYNSVANRFRDLKLKSTDQSIGVSVPKITYYSEEMTYRFRPIINGIVRNICKSHSLITCLENLDSYNEAVRAGFIEGEIL